MPLVKLGSAARRARLGSVTAVRRALRAANVPLVTLSPGVFAVEEADLNRFLQQQHTMPPAAPPPRKTVVEPSQAGTPGKKPANRKRRQ